VRSAGRGGRLPRRGTTLAGILFVVVPFLVGLWLAARFEPALADTREGRIATWVVRILAGAALAVIVVEIYLTVETLHQADFYDGHNQDLRGLTIGNSMSTALFEAGLLLAAAAGVHLLAPSADAAAA
jgi:hypothetical protein